MKSSDLIPVFYQGQPTSADPDHYVTRAEMRRGFGTREYMLINGRKGLLKLTTCRPKYDHKDSVKSGWEGIAENTHSFKFRRDYGALQRRMGFKVMQNVEMMSGRKHGKTRMAQRISYSLTQCADVNGTRLGVSASD
jgi:hypothetical protein